MAVPQQPGQRDLAGRPSLPQHQMLLVLLLAVLLLPLQRGLEVRLLLPLQMG